MITIFLRTILIYLLLLTAVRLMGKREIGQLQPFELVVIIMISNVASFPMENINIPLLQGVIPVLGLLVSQLIFSYLNIKLPIFHQLFAGKPSFLIKKGKIVEDNLKKQRYTIDELMEQLRVSGYADIRKVEYAILETSGEISVIPKVEENTVSLKNLALSEEYTGYPRVVVLEGKLNVDNLSLLNKDVTWLKEELHARNLSLENIMVMVAFENGEIYFQEKGG